MKKHGEKFEGRALGSKGFPTGTCTRIMLKGCPKARYDAPVMDDCGEDGHHLMQSISSVLRQEQESPHALLRLGKFDSCIAFSVDTVHVAL